MRSWSSEIWLHILCVSHFASKNIGLENRRSSSLAYPQDFPVSGTFRCGLWSPQPCCTCWYPKQWHTDVHCAPLHKTDPRHWDHSIAAPCVPRSHTACTLLLSWAVLKRTSSFQDEMWVLCWILSSGDFFQEPREMRPYQVVFLSVHMLLSPAGLLHSDVHAKLKA